MRTLLRIIARRWLVVIPTIALVFAAGFSAASRAKVSYEATGATLLLAPNNAFDPGNPYADYNPALLTTANALQRVLGQPSVQRDLAAAGLSDSYTITIDEKAPIMTVKADAATPDLAIRTVDGLQNEIAQQLSLKEDIAGAGSLARIGSDRIVVANHADKLLDDRNRVIVVAVAGGVLAVCAIAVVAESLARRRAERRAERRAARAAPQPAQLLLWRDGAHDAPAVPVSVAAPAREPVDERLAETAPAPVVEPVAEPTERPARPAARPAAKRPPKKRVPESEPGFIAPAAGRHPASGMVWPALWPDEDVDNGYVAGANGDAESAETMAREDVARNRQRGRTSETAKRGNQPAHRVSTGSSWLDSVADALEKFSKRSGGGRSTARQGGPRDDGPSNGSGNPPES